MAYRVNGAHRVSDMHILYDNWAQGALPPMNRIKYLNQYTCLTRTLPYTGAHGAHDVYDVYGAHGVYDVYGAHAVHVFM